MDLTCPRCNRTGLRDQNAVAEWHRQWVRCSTTAPWCCSVHGPKAGIDGFGCGCWKPEDDVRTRSKPPSEAVPWLPLPAQCGFRPTASKSPCPQPATGFPPGLDVGSASSTTIMPSASSSELVTVTRGEWQDLNDRLRAIEEWLLFAPAVLRAASCPLKRQDLRDFQ